MTQSSQSTPIALMKAPTGIRGFDEVTDGGLPRGRATLVTGAAGTGKTLFGLEFLVRGAQEYDESGVLMAFEESAREIAENVASLGFDVPGLERCGRLAIDAVRLDRSDVVTTGAFDLDGLFIRLGAAIDAVGARRVVLDTVEVLFGALADEAIVRAELGRLLRWLKERGVTTVVTGERGSAGQLSRFGIEEYVSDCVIALDHRIHEEISTRRLRVVKYRGSRHGTNEYSFMINERGFQVFPITSLACTYETSDERISSGIAQLDELMGGGVFRGSTLMISGGSGTGKTTLAAHAANACCSRGEPALFVTFEEAPGHLIRNMRSVGLDLRCWIEEGLLTLTAERSTAFGLEAHVSALHQALNDLRPAMVILDGIDSLTHVGTGREVASAIARLIDLMKSRGVTVVLTSLAQGDVPGTGGVSSLTDSWLLLKNIEADGERNRLLCVMKSRGTAHSNQVREFRLTDRGVELVDVHVGQHGVLTGSARAAALAEESAASARREAEVERRRSALARQTAEVDAKIAVLRAELAAQQRELSVWEAAGPSGRPGQDAALRERQGESG